jgi:hypothetical protein
MPEWVAKGSLGSRGGYTISERIRDIYVDREQFQISALETIERGEKVRILRKVAARTYWVAKGVHDGWIQGPDARC